MLVIRCREGETVAIGDDVEVTVLAAGAGRVKLGFSAPTSVVVVRRCAELTRRQNQAAINEFDAGMLAKLGPYLSHDPAAGVPCVVSWDTLLSKKDSRQERNG